MFTEVLVNTSMEQEFSQTMSGLVKKLIEKKHVTGKPAESLKNQTYNLMKQLAKKFMYQHTDQSMNGETKTELTAKTEFSMRESIFTLIRKKPKKKKREGAKSHVLKHNTRSFHYSNICQMIKNNTTKLIRNKLTLQENSKKIVKKRLYKGEKSLRRNLESVEKLLSSWKKDFKKKAIVGDLRWSMKSTYKSFTMQNEIMEKQIKPVAIVPPLPLPMWAKALDEPTQMVILRKTPSLNSFFDPRSLRSKVIMRRKMRNGSRRGRTCMFPAESLARALSGPKWNKGPRQVPVSTFQATRIHYRFLLAKYGKARLMGRHRVYPNSIRSNVHSNFSVINLLHEVEEAISQNKYSKETDKIVKNFKEELNKDLLYNESTNKKYKYQTSNVNNFNTRKKGKLGKQSSRITLSELVEKLGRNDSDDCYEESDREVKSETCFETGQSQFLDTNNLILNSLVDSGPKGELFKVLNNELPITDINNKLKQKPEQIEISKVSQNKKVVIKEKRTLKRRKTYLKEQKSENISEEERINAILQELHKQIKISELPTPLILTKNDSLTELNFEKEPLTYLGMHGSSITIDTESQKSQHDCLAQEKSSMTKLSEPESQSLAPEPQTTPLIKIHKQEKRQHSSSKLYTFRIDYEGKKNKPMNICNIITALDRVNKLLQNIPIQYDKNTGRPYIVYDPKTIVKVIKEVNIKHEYKMVVKKYNKKTKNGSETDKSLCGTNSSIISKNENTVKKDENGLEEVGNQLLKCILNSMKPQNELYNSMNNEKDKEEYNKYCQTLALENLQCEESLEENAISKPKDHLNSNELLKLSNTKNETIRYRKKYLEQVTKTSAVSLINGSYHQKIIYMERHIDYFCIVQPINNQNAESNQEEMNQKKKEESNNTNLLSNSYAELKEKYMEELKERKSVINGVTDKYGRHPYQSQPRISLKYYQQYNKTRKLLLSKYDSKRNIKKQSLEKDLIKTSFKTDFNESLNTTERILKTDSQNKNNLPNKSNKTDSTQISHIPIILNHNESQNFDLKRCNTIKKTDAIQSVTGEGGKNKSDLIVRQNRPYFNPLITLQSMEQIIINKNELSINTKDNSEISRGFSLNKSIMNNMLRSVSINTIPKKCPVRNDITKQVFYFEITYPLIEDLHEIYKTELSQEYFKTSKHEMLDKFIYYKRNNKLQSYKRYITQHTMGSANTVKKELDKNIHNVGKLLNIDYQLLTKFLNICITQNDQDFGEEETSLMFEREMEEVKSYIQVGEKTNPLKLIQKEHKKSCTKGHQKIMILDNFSKIEHSYLKNEPRVNEININQIVNYNSQHIELLRLFNFLILIVSLLSFFN